MTISELIKSQKTLADLIAEQEEEDNKITAKKEAKRQRLQALIKSLIADKIAEQMPLLAEQLEKELSDTIPSLIPPPVAGKQGKMGIRGERGEKPVLGIDYTVPTAEEIAEKVNIPIPKDGENGSPDTPEEVRDKLSTLEGEERLDAKHIKNLPKGSAGSASKSYFKMSNLTGTINGSNKAFYLDEAPRYGTQIFVLANGQVLQNKTHFTIQGNLMTYLTTAPRGSWQHFAMIFRQ